jgi:hypothetical protein
MRQHTLDRNEMFRCKQRCLPLLLQVASKFNCIQAMLTVYPEGFHYKKVLYTSTYADLS